NLEEPNILLAAEQGYIELYTSAFTMAEVVYIKSLKAKRDLSDLEQENIINNLFSNEWIKLVGFERETSEINRYLIRSYKLQPFDALHLATAIRMKLDYFDTVDQKLIDKVPQEVNFSPNYPKKVIIQKPFIEGFQPPLPFL
ncbi:type II toxin-antitoxin system VapC family toxin, partial [Microcystis sp. T1-4]|uniref:type II toxin-antitoxin system VapC family toxin n=1 Tax=Microcystis sp. T1-4 TaxID=1160279 RepID=UPI000586FF9D